MCEEFESFRYCLVKGKYILGYNTTTPANALISGKTCPEKVVIPEFVKDHKIEEIGTNALKSCTNMKVLIIKARITQINDAALWEAKSLVNIYLPNTLLYIFTNCIHLWDSQLGSGVTNPGITNVYFEKGSKIKYIGSQGICYREFLYLHTCEVIKPEINMYAFNIVQHLYTVSPYNYSLGTSVPIIAKEGRCNLKEHTCNKRPRSNRNEMLLVSYLIFITIK